MLESSSSIRELESALLKAQERALRAVEALAPKHKGGEMEECQAACDAVLKLERDLAAAKREQYAVPIDFPACWDVGAPMPHLLQNDYRAVLVFFLGRRDPKWDGSTVQLRPSDSPTAEGLAVVDFERYICTKMGTPNEEVFNGHPLWGKGFQGCTTLRVENSVWLKELEAINAGHSEYKPSFWSDLKHFILPFHDCTFECVARAFKVEIRHIEISQLLTEIIARLDEPT